MIVSRVRAGTLACWILMLAACVPIVRAQEQPLRDTGDCLRGSRWRPAVPDDTGLCGAVPAAAFFSIPGCGTRDAGWRGGGAGSRKKVEPAAQVFAEGEDAATSVRSWRKQTVS